MYFLKQCIRNKNEAFIVSGMCVCPFHLCQKRKSLNLLQFISGSPLVCIVFYWYFLEEYWNPTVMKRKIIRYEIFHLIAESEKVSIAA